MLWLLAWCFGGIPDSGDRGASDYFACSNRSFLILVFLLSLDIRLWPLLLFLAVPFWLMSLEDLIFFSQEEILVVCWGVGVRSVDLG